MNLPWFLWGGMENSSHLKACLESVRWDSNLKFHSVVHDPVLPGSEATAKRCYCLSQRKRFHQCQKYQNHQNVSQYQEERVEDPHCSPMSFDYPNYHLSSEYPEPPALVHYTVCPQVVAVRSSRFTGCLV